MEFRLDQLPPTIPSRSEPIWYQFTRSNAVTKRYREVFGRDFSWTLWSWSPAFMLFWFVAGIRFMLRGR
jgi:hypothetical protein